MIKLKEISGEIFSIVKNNQAPENCTVSRQIDENIIYFSLAKDTDISAEIFSTEKIIFVLSGEIITQEKFLSQNDFIITPKNFPVGFKAQTSSVYVEIILKEGFNLKLNAGEVFNLSQLVPYQPGRIVNMDIVNNSAMKFVVMAFDDGTGLSEHAAPGEALIFALEGSAIIGYEGKEFHIKAGENFKFAKNGKHFVKANEKFKMALLLTLEG